MHISDIINILGSELSSIYCVDCQNQSVQVYRQRNTDFDIDEIVNNKKTYTTAMREYIKTKVVAEDKRKMLSATNFDSVCKQLRRMPQFTIHYRVKKDDGILCYRMKCARVGEADSFKKIVFAFASEETDIKLNELNLTDSSNGLNKQKILIVENDIIEQKLLTMLLSDEYDVIIAENGKIVHIAVKWCACRAPSVCP